MADDIIEKIAKNLQMWFGSGFWQDLSTPQQDLYRDKARILKDLLEGPPS